MRLLRPANLFVLATYLILSAISFLPLVFGRPLDAPLKVAAIIVICWLCLWTIFKRPAWFHWLLLPGFLALPIQFYLYAYYGEGISTNHLGIITETSPKEAIEFLGSRVWLLAFIALVIVGWWALAWRAAWRTHDLDWNGKSRGVACLLLALIIGVWTYGHEFGIHAPTPPIISTAHHSSRNAVVKVAFKGSGSQPSAQVETDNDDEASSTPVVRSAASTHFPRLPHWAGLVFQSDVFARTWPFGLTVQAYDFWQERKTMASLADKSRTFHFGASRPVADSARQVVVMVIGESSRYDRWSLNGYSRETNPLLEQQKNLVSLSNLITSVSATRLSVPVIVSRKPATESLRDGFSEKSFLSAFNEAGFKTYWLSNQMSAGEFDTPVSVFANEADVTEFLNPGGFTNASSFDKILLTPLQIALDDPAPRKLIVLHTLGSHWNYSHRYPRSFDKWQPSLFGINNPNYTNLKNKTRLNNSYDNSILYTDWFLSQVIERLKAANEISSMMYVSDHGQTLYDGTCHLAFHGHNTQYEFHVPALVWYSDTYAENFAGKVDQLRAHQHAKLTTENIFHTLLDMADIHYADQKLAWSFVSAELKPHTRYVDSYGWTNYDHATIKGDCHEVIDKGTPLAQKQ